MNNVANGLFGPVPSEHQWFARAVCRALPGLKCIFNNNFRSLWFYYVSPWFAQHSEPVEGRTLTTTDASIAIRGVRAAMGQDAQGRFDAHERDLTAKRAAFDNEMVDRLGREGQRRYDFTLSRAHQHKKKPWVSLEAN